MAKMQVSTSYRIIRMISQRASFSTTLGLGRHESPPLSLWRNNVVGDISRRAPRNPQLANTNQYSGVGENTPLAKETKSSKDDWGGPEAEKLIVHLKDNFIEEIKSYDSILVFFYTSWCSHCKRLKSIYGGAAVKMAKDGISGHLGAIDVTKRMDIADMFDIVAVPVLKYFRKGELIMIYHDKRTVDDIVNFMKNTPKKPSLLPKVDI